MKPISDGSIFSFLTNWFDKDTIASCNSLLSVTSIAMGGLFKPSGPTGMTLESSNNLPIILNTFFVFL